MAPSNSLENAPPGLLHGLLFFGVVVLGAGYIVFSKLHEFSAVQVTLVPVLIMIAYALALGLARLFRLRDDQSGDNLYYMGFLFTLTSLAVSLYQFSSAGSAEQIVQNFGIAIGSTIAGITLADLLQPDAAGSDRSRAHGAAGACRRIAKGKTGARKHGARIQLLQAGHPANAHGRG